MATQVTNVDVVNQDEVFTQPETTFENILEYFESYIKTFYAYKDEPTYKAIIQFLINYYLDIIYNLQPEKLKELYESQVISQDIINYLLVSIGLPETLIAELTTTSKFVIMKSFSDFERYKGTVKFFRSIGGAFQDKMSFYELYIDYDETFINPVAKYLMTVDKSNLSNNSYFTISSIEKNYYIWFNYNKTGIDPKIENYIGIEIPYDDTSYSSSIAKLIIEKLNLTNDFYVNVNGTDILEIQLADHGAALSAPSSGTTDLKFKILTEGKDAGAWVLRPKPIYVHPKMDTVTETFQYKDAYDKISTLLLSEDQLNTLKDSNDIILPTKSNIILLDYTSTIESSYLNLLIFTILLEYIGDDYFSVFFTGSSGTTTLTYRTAFFLWYYLLAKYYNVTLEGIEILNYVVMGTDIISDYVLNDIPTIVTEYDNIKTRKDLYSFYFKYIDERFSRVYSCNKPTIITMEETLKKIDVDLYNYVEERIANAEDINQDIRFMMDELYASIVLSFDQYTDNPIVTKYIPILLQFLTQITTNITATDSYKIVYNLKPFHTELFDIARNKIEVDDKFNTLFIDDETDILFNYVIANILHSSDQASFKFTPKGDNSSLSLNSIPLINMKQFATVSAFRDFEIIFHFLFPLSESLNKLEMKDLPDLRVTPKTQTTQLAIQSALSNSSINYIKKTENKISDNFDITLVGGNNG